MASSITEAQAELISSLAQDDIPIKLRCAVCSKLAVNAFRLPCCEQAICETCQQHLPQSCPVCEHSPLSAEDCNPNKSLRTTIKVFLRTAEKKRETSRAKEPKHESPPPTPVETASIAQNLATPQNEAPAVQDLEGPVSAEEVTSTVAITANEISPSHKEEMLDTLSKPVQEHGQEGAPQDDESALEHTESHDQVVATGEGEDSNVEHGNRDVEHQGSEAGAEDYASANYSNQGDLSQMQMMMAMQNGMGANGFNGFPMMGMPGMGMDPMMMQSMYMNGGFQGMGMNGMGGFGGGYGQGSNNNWNGSQSWNFDQNNFNQNGSGMGAGDFGRFNSNFQTGYNQGGYGTNLNDFRRQPYGRGRGRGRGYHNGYGRGGYQQFGGNSNYQDHGQYGSIGQGPQEKNQSGGSVASTGNSGHQVDEFGRDMQSAAPAGDHEDAAKDQAPTPSGNAADVESHETRGTTTNATAPVSAGGSQGATGSIPSVLSMPVPDVPINAPTGPKAMRQGLPNTSSHHLRARGLLAKGSPNTNKAMSPLDARGEAPPTPSRSSSHGRDGTDHRDQDAGRGRHSNRHFGRSGDDDRDVRNSRGEEHERSRSPTVSRSRSRSRNRGHKSSRRRGHHHYESGDDDGHDDGTRRRTHRSSRRGHEGDGGEEWDRVEEERHMDRERSGTPSDNESRRSGHRSRRDHEHEKRRTRDKERYHDDDHDDRKKSSHRSHRDREYDSSRRRDKDRQRERDRDRDRDRDRNRDKDRDKDRDRDRDRESERDRKARKERHRHERERERDRESRRHGESSSRKHSVDISSRNIEPSSKEAKPAMSSRSSLEIKGKAQAAPAPAKDEHTLERERRDRDRLLKEAQRLAGMRGLAGSKRHREDDDGGRKGRRSRRSEAVDDGDDDGRSRR